MPQRSSSAPAPGPTGQSFEVGGDRRSRSRERRRNSVYEAAVELFIADGFNNVTMDQIAESADVARQTVFNHFPRKTAFLDEWIDRRRIRASAAAKAGGGSNQTLADVLTNYMIEMARVSEDSWAETRALLPAALQQTNFLALTPLASELAAIIKEARSDETDPTHIHGGMIGLILTTSYFAVLDRWIDHDPPRFDLEHQLKVVVNIVLRGIDDPGGPFAPADPSGRSDPDLSSVPSTKKKATVKETALEKKAAPIRPTAKKSTATTRSTT